MADIIEFPREQDADSPSPRDEGQSSSRPLRWHGGPMRPVRLSHGERLHLEEMIDSRVRNGAQSNDLVLSAYADGNDAVFPRILDLYVSSGSVVADVTYGKGVFWRNVREGKYDLWATDIQGGVDCRDLPYADDEVDCVVLDPPYMHSPGGTAYGTETFKPFESHYRNNETGNRTGSKYHEAVVELYRDAGVEAFRVLRKRGVFIVKCQDEVCSNRQRFTHVEIMEAYRDIGFIAEDLLVVVRNNRPGVSRMIRQVHARKNHSYFLVFWKTDGTKKLWESLRT